MTEQQAAELIALVRGISGVMDTVVFLLQSVALGVGLGVGQRFAERILWSKNSRKIW